MTNFNVSTPAAGNLDVTWHAGWPTAEHDPAPPIQVHAYNEHTLILRQNKSVHYEAPFLFLLFGNEQALLLDTGATSDPRVFPLRRTVDALIAERASLRFSTGYRLIVAHTHGHGDHIAGDAQFADRPNTTVVHQRLADVVGFYGFADWPNTPRQLDLGGRIVDVLPCPGHEPSAVVFYDRYTGILFTGDTLYPGRLYIDDWSAYRTTVDRLVAFCASRPVTHILGCHIEMTAEAGRDYPLGTTYQPNEPPLQMTVSQLYALRDAVEKIDDQTGIHVFPDFIIHYDESV